jgi:hypothetical protein
MSATRKSGNARQLGASRLHDRLGKKGFGCELGGTVSMESILRGASQQAQQGNAPWWVVVLTIVGALMFASGLLYISRIGNVYIKPTWPWVSFQRHQPPPPVDLRVQQLKASLSDALDVIREIQEEIKSRTQLVSKLEEDIKTASDLAALKKDEVEAVAQVIRGELKSQERRSVRTTLLVNILFFLLGAGISLLVNVVLR